MSRSSTPIVVIGAGQSGLVAARAVRNAGIAPVVLEASSRAAGAWPSFYDSLAAFSPVRFSGIAGFPMPGNPDVYPRRDEVASYLERFADTLDVEVRTNTRVVEVNAEGDGFAVITDHGERLRASGIVAASGSFSNPYAPILPGHETFTGKTLHAAEYRNPAEFADKRVIVVGAGNSAVQIAVELAEVARVTVASRRAPAFVPQILHGHDVHHYLAGGFDTLPPQWLTKFAGGALVMDTGGYREAFESGAPDRRTMFTAFAGDSVVWPDGEREPVDVVLFATGYRPSLGYLDALGALDESGAPLHVGGLSTTHPGLGYVGLEFQRSFDSNTLRGVHRDAAHVTAPLAAYAAGDHKFLAA